MYQALYRKWRPRTFDDVVGQEQVTETLKNQVINGRMSHAYLFIGTRGTGKTTCAKILARAVNCEHPENGNPCNKCRSCLGIEDGSILDVVELDAASNNGVDNVRALRDEAIYSPATVKKRVYIVDEVHMLSTSAFNALLKILEEPPEHLMFILATTELHKVPATILSRCQRHSFKRIDPDALADRLSYVAGQENMTLEPNAASLLARLADGSLRDGLSLLDQCSGSENITTEGVLSAMGLAGNLRIAEMLEVVLGGDAGKAVTLFGDLWHDGKAPATLLSELGTLLRDILMLKVAPKGGRELLSGGYDLETLSVFAKRMTQEELICNIDTIQANIGSLRDGRNPKTTAELCLVELCEPKLGDSLDTLKKRIARLEIAVANGVVCNDEGKKQETPVTEKKVNPVLEYSASSPVVPEVKQAEIIREDKFETKHEENLPPFETENISVSAEPTADAETHSNSEPAASADSDDIWKQMLSELKATMLPGHFNLISNLSSEFSSNTLTIMVTNAFQKGQLEQSKVMECIRSASTKVIGRTVQIKIDIGDAAQNANTDKLKDLTKFGNVKFE